MADVRSTYVHERRINCFLDRHELTRVVREYAVRQAGLHPGAPNLTVKVKFEDETEGSPSYTVGTKARVEIVEALAEVKEGETGKARLVVADEVDAWPRGEA